jgi:hypothetical protein
MVKLKYAPGVTPLRNEHCGCTFQNSRIGQTAMNGQKNDRERQSRQMNKKANLMQAVTNWRNLPPVSKANWSNFATNYPQPCKNPASGFLTGYQLFIKRQQYLFLNEGIKSEFLEAPFSEVLILDNYTFTVDQTENCLDVTENYIHNFGLIPSPGQFLLIKVLAYAVKSGQFFPVVTQTIEILESYIDGLFISLHLPVNCRDTVFSVYLSKPVNQSVAYSGTKTRYMGCFTTKTFLGLTDTPDSYVGQAGKKVKVKADESGLEFVPDTGGGITCADLPNCPTIISMNATDQYIMNLLVNQGLTSNPAVGFGLLYNSWAQRYASGFPPAGWHTYTEAEHLAMVAFLGGNTLAGGKLKEMGLDKWDYPNTGATNAAKYNLRASGYRDENGLFVSFRSMSITYVHATYSQYGARADKSSAYYNYGGYNTKHGLSSRWVKDATTLTEGMSGSVTGNNGRIYRTIVINGKEMTADAVAETKFRNGTAIPLVTDTAAWAALTTPAYCYPNGDIANV